MIVGFLGQDERLCDELLKIQGVNIVYSYPASAYIDRITQLQTCDIILISDRDVSPYELGEWKKRFEGSRLIYLLSYHVDLTTVADIEMVCKKHGITTLPPKRTSEQLAAEVAKIFFDSTNIAPGGKVITFIGALSQVGLTATVLSLAETLAQNTSEVKVGVLGFNCANPGDGFLSYKGSYLNQLHAQSEVLSAEELVSNMHRHDSGFCYLAGNTDLTKKYRYPSESAQHIIQAAKEAFDLVLIDAGEAVDNNLCLQALMHADMRVLVTTTQPTAIMQWRRQHEMLQLVAPNLSFMLLINKGDANGGKSMEQRLKMPLLGWIPAIASGYECELEQRLLTTTDSVKYSEQIFQITKLIQIRFDFEAVSQQQKSSWFRRLWK
ncbi:hypothetical protein D3P09_02650 [Paenibacillus pinisoli]|uniref:AAA domain-containing protein n=1 Tax=Paenibacillus pinisoli TaxID=1276110 RepID=A0A3A6PIH2_9BACL|nr:hypothetical protein [Paenibacillus pinisoli]RJX40935.1 hypothetical protein D3P09_02650 [Paenibacillus pinisoli]